MGITLILLGMLSCLLLALATRIGLHEFCHRFDGEKNSPPGRRSITPYWLTFRSTDGVTFQEGKEAFQDRNARFQTRELAIHDSARVNAARKVKGEPAYTVLHSSDGTEWPLE